MPSLQGTIFIVICVMYTKLIHLFKNLKNGGINNEKCKRN